MLWRAPRLHSHGRDVTQVAVAEMEVTLGCFACHVPSWLSTKACRQLVSFSRTTHGRGRQEGNGVGEMLNTE